MNIFSQYINIQIHSLVYFMNFMATLFLKYRQMPQENNLYCIVNINTNQ
jgi:hypothetical protein